jgi:hypothetical protein
MLDFPSGEPTSMQMHIAALALAVSAFSLLVSVVVAYFQWRDRSEKRRDELVPGFETHSKPLQGMTDWYEVKIVVWNLGRTQVILEEIAVRRPLRARIGSKDSFGSYNKSGVYEYRKAEIHDLHRRIEVRLPVAPKGSEGVWPQMTNMGGPWPGTADHTDTSIFVYLPPSWLGRTTRSVSLRMICRRKDRRDLRASEVIRVNMTA